MNQKKDLRIAKLITGELIVGNYNDLTQTYEKCVALRYYPVPEQKGMIYPALSSIVPENLLEGNFGNKIDINIPKEKTIFDLIISNIKKEVGESFVKMYTEAISGIVKPTMKNVFDFSGKKNENNKS